MKLPSIKWSMAGSEWGERTTTRISIEMGPDHLNDVCNQFLVSIYDMESQRSNFIQPPSGRAEVPSGGHQDLSSRLINTISINQSLVLSSLNTCHG